MFKVGDLEFSGLKLGLFGDFMAAETGLLFTVLNIFVDFKLNSTVFFKVVGSSNFRSSKSAGNLPFFTSTISFNVYLKSTKRSAVCLKLFF